MKYHFFLLFILFSVFGFGQKSKIDLKAIEKNLKNPDSPYNYDKLIFKYKGYPKSLDSIEAQHLYYGRNFRNDKIATSDERFKSLAEAFKQSNFEECIKLGKALYDKDPTNLDVLLILLRSYDSLKDGTNFMHHLNQLRTLTDGIKSSGDGKTEKTAYLVNSIGDEYILLNILNIGKEYTRSSKPSRNGMFDIWEKDGRQIYIKILYLELTN
ncbi:DUF4919 domain-containing protein [Chryseobacterium lactis]|uniref:DUF4919 domain-containing protein n=1 Tax=Chryseobacterium lactis TaxID=1241981 RepID=A0A3G6RT82_CHRLC|nr:DUF4919 domain-containing protein [Chryseobacterium lactis]AZA81501.1 DUF4919 domain-containing protein [Chryseobacterium lactis]AZB06499.1 DUF4919 domain-containing protein [Chryseobacterium lactis]PNW15350.1 DUF4919 domain-containing protein [Chryseobacterium lactis]